MHIHWPAGVDTNVFLSEYWQQKPLLIKGAFPTFANPLDENELAGLALDEDANSRFIECVDGNEWRLSHGPFDEDFFSSLTGNQWSLLISDIEKLLPDFRQYLEPFRFLPDWRVDDLMISYAPEGGSVGAHVDQYDVFLLQAAGVREWQYENTPREPTQHNLNSSIALLSDFDADATHQLSTGDMLYLPPKFAHHGIAASPSCMTWSIGFRAPSVDEMLPSLVGYILDETDPSNRFSDAGRHAADLPGQVTDLDFSKLRQLILEAMQIDSEVMDKCIGRYLSEPSSTDPITTREITEAHLFDNQQLATSLVCNSEHSLAYKINGSRAWLFANGECFDVSRALAEQLCHKRQTALSEIKTEDRAAITALVAQHSLIEDEAD